MTKKKVCVVGAGISGISLAQRLMNSGVEVILLDRNPYPGGRAARYGCKAVDECVKCGVCLLRNTLCDFREEDRLRVYFSSTLNKFQQNRNGGFNLSIIRQPNRIDPRLCYNCGRCSPVCPENAIRTIAGWKPYIDSSCTDCGECVSVCPVAAISLKREPAEENMNVDALALCTGFMPFDPAINRKYGYGGNLHVITGTDMEEFFYNESYPAEHIKKIAFVQCVGSRNRKEGKEHCSRICCSYALRMANRILHETPGTQIDFFYMDIQLASDYFRNFYGEIRNKFNFIRSMPVCIKDDENGKPLVRYDDPVTNHSVENLYDLVVLSQGTCPQEDATEMADLTGVNMDEYGFFLSVPQNGIFASGACKGPMAIEECIKDASAVSEEILSYLGGR
ncbi:MAG: CoB--CoM heterodisulfide reductase iron-sulfur subunit A family protein [Spirochaetales bacterium]|nr:CoB--CoM heterodisulfide reductase iron-sulfur subunit A family protein [Spirochaetales bacterium]